MSIGNLVWDDVDDSGTVDSGEPGLPGVPVLLRQGGDVIASTTTDLDGHYLFTLLAAGQYELEVTAPVGYQSSTGLPSGNLSEQVRAAIDARAQ